MYPNVITGMGLRGGEGGSVKPYVIIKGGLSQSLRSLTEGGRGGQKSEKLPYVIYERPLSHSTHSIFQSFFQLFHDANFLQQHSN